MSADLIVETATGVFLSTATEATIIISSKPTLLDNNVIVPKSVSPLKAIV